jgi:[ribosomal protein S5]-alanine N-acetyltransferase
MMAENKIEETETDQIEIDQLETERLMIRSLRQGDAEDMHRLIYGDEQVSRYYSGDPIEKEKVAAKLGYRISEAEFSDFQRWAIVKKNRRQFIGLVGLEAGPNFWYRFKSDPQPKFNTVEVEISFALGRIYWGQGYAREACERIIEYAFTELKIPRLIGGFDARNEGSHRLHERLGFSVEKEAGGENYVAVLANDRL